MQSGKGNYRIRKRVASTIIAVLIGSLAITFTFGAFNQLGALAMSVAFITGILSFFIPGIWNSFFVKEYFSEVEYYQYDVTDIPCCGDVRVANVKELPHVNGFDLDLVQCGRCGQFWIKGTLWERISNWHAVSREDSTAFISLEGDDLVKFSRRWADNNGLEK